jgi:hypothetical protein
MDEKLISCRDPKWKHELRRSLEARREITVTDFDELDSYFCGEMAEIHSMAFRRDDNLRRGIFTTVRT